MKKLDLSETKYIKIDTIDKDVQIFEDIYPPSHSAKVVVSAVVPLSLIKLLTEVDKHVLLEGHVLFYDLKKRSTRRHFSLLDSRDLSQLVEWNGYLLYSEMILDGCDLTGGLWSSTSTLANSYYLPRLTLDEWVNMYNFISKVEFPYNPSEDFHIYTGLSYYTTLEDRIFAIYWNHNENRYFAPEEIEE